MTLRRPSMNLRPPTPNSAASSSAPALQLRVASAQSPFEALVESIVYQQLHGKAAATIHRRLLEGFRYRPCAALTASQRRASARLPRTSNSAPPASRTTRALPSAISPPRPLDGTVPTLARIRRMSDDAHHRAPHAGARHRPVDRRDVPHLSPRPSRRPARQRLRRPQRLRPHLRQAQAQRQGHSRRPPKPDVMRRRGRTLESLASIASWYLWRACDLASGKLLQPE